MGGMAPAAEDQLHLAPLAEACRLAVEPVANLVASCGEMVVDLCPRAPPEGVVRQSRVDRRCDVEPVVLVRLAVVLYVPVEELPHRTPGLTVEDQCCREADRIGVGEVEADEHALAAFDGIDQQVPDRGFRRPSCGRIRHGRLAVITEAADPDGVLAGLGAVARTPIDGDVAIEDHRSENHTTERGRGRRPYPRSRCCGPAVADRSSRDERWRLRRRPTSSKEVVSRGRTLQTERGAAKLLHPVPSAPRGSNVSPFAGLRIFLSYRRQDAS